MTDTLPRYPGFDRDIPLTIATWGDLLAEVGLRFDEGSGFGIVTMNLDHLVKLRASQPFQDAYMAHDLRVADGNPLVWLSRLAKRPVELIPGADLVQPLCKLAAAKSVPVAFVGSRDTVLATAAERLEAEFPGLKVVCKIAPPMGFDPTSEAATDLLDQVAASGARMVFIALGAPKQELLATLGLKHEGIGFVSIGASLDFIAGFEQRAPNWARRLALEWVWRMLSNPRRLALRYLQCALLMPRLALHAWRQRRAP